MKSAWNDVVSCMKLHECAENEHGWWNAVMLENNGERLAAMKVRRIVDVSAISENYFKSQGKRKCGKV